MVTMGYDVDVAGCTEWWSIEGEIKGRKPQRRPRNSYISQLKRRRIDTYAGLKMLTEDREKWRTKLNVVNQLSTSKKYRVFTKLFKLFYVIS